MDYNDNEFQSQNLELAGEGNTKFPPVLRPYALPKFDFDDSLHGHLRFDSLVETGVFLGFESNEDNQWIEEYSRGGSGIEFRTSAAESCSISRHNDVWSEATSSESVEMLLKSVGQEENIPVKTIVMESDACDELSCVVKQMEPHPKHVDDNISKGGNVIDLQPILPPDEVVGNFSASVEDIRGGQPLVDASFQKIECGSSVGGGLSDPVSDAVSGKDNLTLSKESYAVDQRKMDTSLACLSKRTEEDSSASEMQLDSVVSSAPNISISSIELNRQDSPTQEKNSISENVGVIQTGSGDQGLECHFVQKAEISYQNSDGNVADSGITHSENPFCLASSMESLEEGNIIEATTGKGVEPSNMLKEGSYLHQVEGCNENIQAAKCASQVPLQEFEAGDTSKVDIHESSPAAFERDNSSYRHGVEVGNASVSKASLLPPEESKFPKTEAVENSGSFGGAISTADVEHSATQLSSEKPVNLTSKGVNDVSEVCVEASNTEVNDSSLLPPEENNLSKTVQNSGGYGGGISTADMEDSATQLSSEKPLNLTSKGVNDVSEVCVEASNTEVNDSSLLPPEDNDVSEVCVEASHTEVNDSSLLPPEENKLSKTEAVKNSGGYGGGISTANMEDSATQLSSEKPLNLTSKGVDDVSEVCVEASNTEVNDSSLFPQEENKLSKNETVENSGSYGGGISTANMEHSATQLPSEKPVNLTSKGVNDVSEVCVEDSNTEVNDSSFIVAESVQVREGNFVSKQSGVNYMAVDVKESAELPSDCSNMYQVVKGTTENELIVSKSYSDASVDNEPALEDASLASHDTTEGVILPSVNVDAANAAVIHQEVQMMDVCCEESQCDGQVAPNEVSQECVKEIGGCTAIFDPSSEVQGAEVQVSSEQCEEATMEENLGRTSSKVSDAEPLPKNSETPAQPFPLEEIYSDADQNRLEDDESKLISGDKTSGQVAMPCISGDALKIHQVSISTTTLSESDAKFHALESGSSGAYLDKSTCASPTVIRETELCLSENEKQGVKGSTDQNNPASEDIDGDANKFQSVSPDSKGTESNDASKGDKTFSFEVSPLVDSSQNEAGRSWQPFSTIQATTVSPTVEGTPPTSGHRPSNSKIAQDASRGNLQDSDKEILHSVSKGTSARKTRRTSKAAGKETVKKGNPLKDTTSARQSGKGDRICQLVASNEMQYMHVDGRTKPFVLTTSASALPDLNTSSPSIFQQPFTDLQQVQLRAQIFVYGALIQGATPDEAYMISAFGGPDGGRSMWETAWRACTERLHGQKSLLNNAETPLQSRSGARAPDHATKQGAILSKIASLPLGIGPPPIVNPIIPPSSPLWSIPTPSADRMQSSGVPRSAVMDYQQALSPLDAHQTPSIRNFVGHNTAWISQAAFRGTLVASPQTSGLDVGAGFPVLPIAETVQLTPPKEPSLPHSSGVKHVSSGPMIQSVSPATVFCGTSPMLDRKKMTPSPSQHSTDPKPRKRKKIPISEDFGPIMSHSQSQTGPASAPIVSSHLSTSVSIATPASLASKASTDIVIMPESPATSADYLRGGNKEAQQRASLSQETHTKLKEARTHAEDASAFAAAAISHRQEIWSQLDKQKNSGLVPDVESKLASAAVAIAAAAAVAKAAAAAANVAASAALQAKLMADEALDSSGCGNSNKINGASLSDCVKDMGKANPASTLKGENAVSCSSSIIFAAREAARRQVEAASAASKKAENMDAIVKAAELATEAVSQAGKIVALGDPLPLDELIEAGPEGYWKVSKACTQLVATSSEVNCERLNMDGVEEGPDTSAKHSREVRQEHNSEIQTSNQGRFATLRNASNESFDDRAQLVDGISGSVIVSGKNSKGHKGRKASDLAKTIGVVPESEIGSRSPSITIQMEREREAEPLKDNSIKEGSCVEVFKEGVQFKAGWFTAIVSSLKDGKAYVCYNELPSDEGLEKLKEWVSIEGEGEKAPKIRIARPVTAMPFEGTRKRRRAAMEEYTWSVGDRVDAWIQNSWWEGVVMEKSKKDDKLFTVHFPAQGQTSAVRAWHLRPSFIWKDGEWVEWSSSTENNQTYHEGDTPQEKRLRLRSPTVEAKGKDKIFKGDGIVESGNPDEPTLLDLAANEKLFNIGKSGRDENKPDALRMIRSGLQKEGSRVVFGVPKPGKKRKFMDVSKHYVADKGSMVTESNDSVKFAKYLMPQSRGSGSRGWKNSVSEPKEKCPAVSRPKVLKPGKLPTVSGRTIPQKGISASSAVSAFDDGADIDHTTKIKDFVRHAANTSGKHVTMEFQSLSTSDGTAVAPILFSSMPSSSDAPSRKVSASNPKTERLTKGKLAPAGGKLNKIEENKVFNGNSAKTSEVVEPRRSNRRIQPTSRLLEGLQSSLIISKNPSVSLEKIQKSQNRTVSKGNKQWLR